jgi:hypothetical protein
MLDRPASSEPQIQSPSKPKDFAKSSYSYHSHAQKNVKYLWVPATIIYSNLDYSVAMEHNLARSRLLSSYVLLGTRGGKFGPDSGHWALYVTPICPDG